MPEYDNENKLILSKKALNLLFEKIILPNDIMECWKWKASHHITGYAKFETREARYNTVHRIIYELMIEKIPDKFVIDHICCNRWCVNPAHLEAILARENLRRGSTILRHKGYCPNGHKLELENIYINPTTGQKRCRTCLKIQKKMCILNA